MSSKGKSAKPKVVILDSDDSSKEESSRSKGAKIPERPFEKNAKKKEKCEVSSSQGNRYNLRSKGAQ